MAQTEENGTPVAKTRDRKVLLWMLRIIPALLLLGFILLNTHPVEIRFLLWKVQTSLIWAMVTTAGLGFVIGYFAHRVRK
jgi:uncharacterized integral membrane protein